ncbi:O-antigen ligase family protein [Streptomyces sp. NPDC005648]|uniref:O-antigen ligase family protein n=1 Tax=Streptomyces sp. NPDC005648 TaxID=3157044 RepID=UPI0033B6DE60
MSQAQYTSVLIIGILGLLALFPWAVAFHRAHVFRDWDLTATLVLVVGVLANTEAAAYIIGSGRKERLDPQGRTVIGFPDWVNRIDMVANGLILVACALFVLYRLLMARARINTAPLIAVMIVLALGASDGLHGQPLWAPRQLTLLMALFAAAVGRPGRSAFLGGAAVAMVYTVISGVEALVAPTSVVRPCRADNACNVLGIHYAGVFSNENIFALLLLVCVPFAWLGLRGGVRIVLSCYLAFLALVTGSVLAGTAAVVTVILLVLLRPKLADEELPGTPPVTPAHRFIGMSAVLSAVAIGVVVPLRHADFGDLRLRAAIWDMAKEEWTRSPLLGYGGKAWSAKYEQGAIPAAVSPSLHNEWIDVLYAGGLVGVFLFAVLLVYLLFRDGPRRLPAAACVLLPVLLGSVLERPWSFGISNSLTFALLATTLMPIGARLGATPEPLPEPPGEGRSEPAGVLSGDSLS